MSTIQQSRLPGQMDLSLRRVIRKPLWCIWEGESVSFTTLSRQENEKLKHRLRLARRAAKTSKAEADTGSTQLDESLKRMTKVIDINSLNDAPGKVKSLQHAKRPRMWESLEDTCKKMREGSEENSREGAEKEIEVEEWYEVSDDKLEQDFEREKEREEREEREERVQERDMKEVISHSRFNKIVFVESQVNLTQIQSSDVQESTKSFETSKEKLQFLVQQTPITSKIIESFDFTTYLSQSQSKPQTLTPTFKQLNEESQDIPPTVSTDIKPPSDSFPTVSSLLSYTPASSLLNSANTNSLLESSSIETLLSKYLRCMHIPFQITYNTDTFDITTCKIFLNGNLASSAKHLSKHQARRLASARCMKIMNKNLLLKWALSKKH